MKKITEFCKAVGMAALIVPVAPVLAMDDIRGRSSCTVTLQICPITADERSDLLRFYLSGNTAGNVGATTVRVYDGDDSFFMAAADSTTLTPDNPDSPSGNTQAQLTCHDVDDSYKACKVAVELRGTTHAKYYETGTGGKDDLDCGDTLYIDLEPATSAGGWTDYNFGKSC